MDLPKKGTIYLYERTPSGKTYLVPIEETPDEIQVPVHAAKEPLTGWNWRHLAAMVLFAITVDGLIISLYPKVKLESQYFLSQAKAKIAKSATPVGQEMAKNKIVFNPLTGNDGTRIDPINTEFSIIVPKIGINASVTEGVDPTNPKEYNQVLKTAVAHAATSFTPDKSGTVYLFSHSTNYDWFVSDLNAVFYLLKNLESDDYIVVFYKGVRYTYRLTEKRVVKPSEISYLVPEVGKKKLILQTCWPPGMVAERLLIFADLVDEETQQI